MLNQPRLLCAAYFFSHASFATHGKMASKTNASRLVLLLLLLLVITNVVHTTVVGDDFRSEVANLTLFMPSDRHGCG